MNNLKKFLAFSTASIAMLSVFVACNKKTEEAPEAVEPAVTDEMLTEDEMAGEDVAVEEESSDIDEEAVTDDVSSESSSDSEASAN